MTMAGLLLADDEMPQHWWVDAFTPEQPDPSWQIVLARLSAAFAVGLLVAGVYRFTATPTKRTRSFVTTLTMMCILIALVTLVVRGNVARAFSLAGTLAIVRFRTVVQDTRDTAFVILAVIAGMALGGGHYTLALWGLSVCAAAAWLLRNRKNTVALATAGDPWKLAVRVVAEGSSEALREGLAKSFAVCDLCASETVKKGTFLDLRYEVVPRRELSLLDCVNAIKALPGVQSVKLTRQ